MMEEFLFTSEPESVSELHREKALLTAMLQRARLYHTSRLYLDLLEFVNRLPHIAPFNALLLSIQKPGLRFAASAGDWCVRFNRTINEGARPLVILWPFGPVAFVYDVEDTSGDPLPELAARTFRASGPIDSVAIAGYEHRLWRKGIDLGLIAYGDGYAGQIAADGLIAVHQSLTPKEKSLYRLRINSRHEPNVQFSTLIHELAHLYLGHLGFDAFLRIPDRSSLSHAAREIEAESLSYLVCHRAGVHTDADSYLAAHVDKSGAADTIDVFALMRAAGQIETALGIAVRIRGK